MARYEYKFMDAPTFMVVIVPAPIKLTVGQSIFVYIARTGFYPNETKDVENGGNIYSRKQS